MGLRLRQSDVVVRQTSGVAGSQPARRQTNSVSTASPGSGDWHLFSDKNNVELSGVARRKPK